MICQPALPRVITHSLQAQANTTGISIDFQHSHINHITFTQYLSGRLQTNVINGVFELDGAIGGGIASVVNVWLDSALQHIQNNELHETENRHETNKPHDEKAGIKLHVSRGAGGRGYSTKNIAKPTVTISTFDFPSHYSAWQDSGVELGICDQALGLSPLLAGHKHNNRLEQILMKDEMDQANEVDGVVLDISGNVIETTMANLFWLKGQSIYTPQLTQSGVEGVMRKQVLTALNQAKLSVTISDYCLSQLMQADEVFMTNSILGVAPVIRISDTQFNIGTVTRSLQGQLNS